MILVDTSVWIEFFRHTDAWEADRLAAALTSDEEIAICGPVCMEIRQGIADTARVDEIERLFSPLTYLPTLRNTYRRAADLYRAVRANGKMIRNSIDCLIAACAVEHRAQLLHRDRDFLTISEISRLELLRPK
jgi:predicted nucleic acid-binding protein